MVMSKLNTSDQAEESISGWSTEPELMPLSAMRDTVIFKHSKYNNFASTEKQLDLKASSVCITDGISKNNKIMLLKQLDLELKAKHWLREAAGSSYFLNFIFNFTLM